MAIGGSAMKPADEKKIPLEPGKHVVVLQDIVSGVSEKTGNPYWINKLVTESGVEFDHFIQMKETTFKPMDKVFKRAASQMDSLMIYDKIGEQPDYDKWFEQAIDLTYALKGKKIEYTVKKFKLDDGKEGVWGDITGYMDMPNEAVQVVVKTPSPSPGVDPKEKLPF